ncbi:MAG TPA: class I SAM-dependent methyltransferase [Micromonosporaceae bacterium]|jgi:cyclopropane-fatty-acyl-phospholipid synthase|nr:class I SAM-dependent methyltransferase [Micromonosporaceae bacterium]
MSAPAPAVIPRRITAIAEYLAELGTSSELELPGGETVRFGDGEPAFRVTFTSERALRMRPTEFALGRAYANGDIDFAGDITALLKARDRLRPTTLGQGLLLAVQLLLPPTWTNARAIGYHYTLGDDFYLSFIDNRYRFYSHCLFHSEDETLEDAAEHKLESMWDALGLKPGMRLLDIGGGWGGVTEYCGQRGVHVTSLTLVEDSANYIRRLIKEKDLPGEVIVEDVLTHRPAQPYDHAVIYGVIEHIPNYRRFCTRLWDALRPGGRLYLDASAVEQKYAVSAFTRRYTWRGPHTFLALQDMIGELLLHGFEIVDVKRETRDYELTIRHWAQRLNAAHERIAGGWGEQVYRRFLIFLWGGAHAFATNRLQAYHLVAERRASPGPRPGALSRTAGFIRSLR